jgi:hypothetical protein
MVGAHKLRSSGQQVVSVKTPVARGLDRLIVMCLSDNTLTENVEITEALSESTTDDLLQVNIKTDTESDSSDMNQQILAELCKKHKCTEVRALIAEEKYLLAKT